LFSVLVLRSFVSKLKMSLNKSRLPDGRSEIFVTGTNDRESGHVPAESFALFFGEFLGQGECLRPTILTDGRKDCIQQSNGGGLEDWFDIRGSARDALPGRRRAERSDGPRRSALPTRRGAVRRDCF